MKQSKDYVPMIIKAVLDTNVFISGIFWEGNYCSQIINMWRDNNLLLVSSLEIIKELVKTLNNFKIKMPSEMIKGWQTMIFENSTIVAPAERFKTVKEDPDDDKFLEAAYAGKANYIITQDKHLLKLKEFRGITIIKPEEFLKLKII